MYTIEELTRAAKVQFGLKPALVEAALRATGKEKFTLDEARTVIEKFSLQEVKK